MNRPLRILHCLRAPVGGLFRHVRDVAAAQAERGHLVGILADESTGGEAAEAAFADLRSRLALGITRVRMSRHIGLSDYPALIAARTLAGKQKVDVLHGHGAKGGAYGRLAVRSLKRSGQRIVSFYTPHGGSLHYEPGSLKGMLFLGLERRLAALTDGLIFESAFSERVYRRKVGEAQFACRVIPNGLLPGELVTVATAPDAADFLFIGELRLLKGIDVLIDALAALTPAFPSSTLLVVGAGPDREMLEARAKGHGLGDRIRFAGAMPARQAFALGRCLVVPSRAESLPYIVLEGAAAGRPMLLSDVGGIPEIVAGSDTRLLPAGDIPALTRAMGDFLASPRALEASATRLREVVASRFSAAGMNDAILSFYEERLAG